MVERKDMGISRDSFSKRASTAEEVKGEKQSKASR
jgi:hypothetical protein